MEIRRLPASKVGVLTREQDCAFCRKPASSPLKKEFLCNSCVKTFKRLS